jgi:hypothetical protein
MKEILVRVAAPASLFVVEVEAPTRVVHVADGQADFERLALWYLQRPERASLLGLAFQEAGVLDGTARGRAWSKELGREPGGIVDALERLLAGR